jgi:hypothetical protein
MQLLIDTCCPCNLELILEQNSIHDQDFYKRKQSTWTAAPFNTTTDIPLCHSNSQCCCPYLFRSVLIPTPTALLISHAAKLTFTFWASGFMCLSVPLGNRQYALHLSTSYGFNMPSHLALPVSCLPFTVISHSPFTTSCFRTRLQVYLGWRRAKI